MSAKIIDCWQLKPGQKFKQIDNPSDFIFVGIINNRFTYKDHEDSSITYGILLYHDISNELNERIFEYLAGKGIAPLTKELVRKIIQSKMIKIGNRFYRKSNINVEIYHEEVN